MSPLTVELTGLSPWQACRLLADQAHLVFFDSALESDLGRYSFVAADPFVWLEGRGGDPFAILKRQLASFRLETIPDLPPFQGGAAGLFGYELGHHLERLPRACFHDLDVPELGVGIYDWVIGFDVKAKRAWLISTGAPESDRRALQRRDHVLRLLDRPIPPLADTHHEPILAKAPQFPIPHLPGMTSNFDERSYEAMIRRAIEYIHAGDCFQVNLAQRLQMFCAEPALAIYERLRKCNPAPFAGYLDLGNFSIASASPERFLRLQGQTVEARPIKGTIARGSTPEEDRRLADMLTHSAKDRAENVMIVDLLRNDLGRVCEYGSVEVASLCKLESYATVHHLVSQVRGQLRSGLDAADLLKATFPGGSVTGAPKIRAMEIITELEQLARGPYCGSLGYIGFDGTMDMNLLIRTLVMGPGWAHFSVGGGIVADSNPEKEYEETWHKAAGMLRALGTPIS